MDDRQRRENERNKRANEFLNANLADFAQNKVAHSNILYLAEKVSKINHEFQKWSSGELNLREDDSVVSDAYDELLDVMLDVRNFANALAKENPSFENKFRLPRQGVKSMLASTARLFADDAIDLRQLFIDQGMDANFINDLLSKANALEEALAEAEASIGDHPDARQILEGDIQEAGKIIEILDPIVRRVYRRNPIKLAAWISASHVERYNPGSSKSLLQARGS